LDVLRTLKQEKGGFSALKYSDLKLNDAVVAAREASGQPYVVRLHVPEEGVCTFKDMLRGDIEMDWGMIDCQILMKSDGMPTYHLANVVDDHLMEISHVIRGEEWLSSAPKHQLLYKYFGWDMPELCHMPLLRNPDKSKLSKRKTPTSILYYKRIGVMPEAVLNFLGRMGWSMPDESEKFTRQEMFDNFDIQRVSLGGPIFDQGKLSWLNSQCIRDLSEEEFVQKFVEWGLDKEKLMPAVKHIQPRIERFSDVAPLAGFLLSGMPEVTVENFAHNKITQEEMVKLLQMGLWQLEAIRNWQKLEIQQRLFALAKNQDVKVKDFLFGFFVSIAGSANSFSVLDSMEILGPDMSRARIRSAIEILGGVSKKAMKKLEKEYRSVSQEIEVALSEASED
jgi:glutamyl-tRNA synthetase